MTRSLRKVGQVADVYVNDAFGAAIVPMLLLKAWRASSPNAVASALRDCSWKRVKFLGDELEIRPVLLW